MALWQQLSQLYCNKCQEYISNMHPLFADLGQLKVPDGQSVACIVPATTICARRTNVTSSNSLGSGC